MYGFSGIVARFMRQKFWYPLCPCFQYRLQIFLRKRPHFRLYVRTGKPRLIYTQFFRIYDRNIGVIQRSTPSEVRVLKSFAPFEHFLHADRTIADWQPLAMAVATFRSMYRPMHRGYELVGDQRVPFPVHLSLR